MYKALLSILCSVSLLPAFAQRETDTFRLYFDLGVPALNQSTEKKIDLLIYNDKIISGSTVMIIGYADYLGSEGFNKNLSMRRAENVKKYLVKYGLNANDIKVCVGKGQIEREGMKDKEGYPTDRRVDIVVNNKVKIRQYADNTPKISKKDSGKPPTTTNLDEIKRMKVGSVILLKNVYFPADRHVIKPESVETLDKLYAILKDNPKLKISIEGHVCCISDAPDALDIDTYEPYLSVNRAKEIYNFLVHKGIDPKRLRYVGFGKRKPVVEHEITEEDAEKNRRVEIRVVENE